ncbi:MAG: hypothetical protein Q9224_006491, partial [Gallowayella concinna]
VCEIAESFGWKVEKRPIEYGELPSFTEVMAAGTAAALVPIKSITMKSKGDKFLYQGGGDEPGPACVRLLTTLKGIQQGKIKDSFGWLDFVDKVESPKESQTDGFNDSDDVVTSEYQHPDRQPLAILINVAIDMPLLPASSQTNSSAKKQQSISSFFGKTSTTPKLTQSAGDPSNKNPYSPSLEATEDSLFLGQDIPQETSDGPSPESRPQKRGHHGADIKTRHLTDAVESQSRKRVKVSHTLGDYDTSTGDNSFSGQCPPERPNPQLKPFTTNPVHRSKSPERTSKYTFSSSPSHDTENLDDEETRQTKEKLHQRFVKKLGRPDSIAEIKRRNWVINESAADQVEDGEEAEEAGEEETVRPPPKGKKGTASRKSASKLTPMERQVLEIKSSHMDTLLVVEVGYKFKFFGEDARTAAKELSIVCIPGKFRYDEHPSEAHIDRFASASIPVHRLHVHVKRLVGAGHKVGIVRQLETAALKAVGDNRNTPFVRKLTNVYTKGTYIDD